MHMLHLLRHAKSSWDDDSLADHERPLSVRGVRDAKRLAKHLGALDAGPDLVLALAAPGPHRDAVSVKFPTCALATLALGERTWSALRQGDTELVGYTIPRDLR